MRNARQKWEVVKQEQLFVILDNASLSRGGRKLSTARIYEHFVTSLGCGGNPVMLLIGSLLAEERHCRVGLMCAVLMYA